MADTKKEQERDELHKAIWGIADDLRGSVDGWDFKQYVLGMMFYRYVAEQVYYIIIGGLHNIWDSLLAINVRLAPRTAFARGMNCI